jgi:hypothetical protein
MTRGQPGVDGESCVDPRIAREKDDPLIGESVWFFEYRKGKHYGPFAAIVTNCVALPQGLTLVSLAIFRRARRIDSYIACDFVDCPRSGSKLKSTFACWPTPRIVP